MYTADRLKDDGIVVLCMSPGYCATNLNEFAGVNPPEHGGAAIAHTVTVEKLDDGGNVHGAFFGDTPGAVLPW
jgi:hypothetical protein